MQQIGDIIWTPSAERLAHTNMREFVRFAKNFAGRDLDSWESLYEWSISQTAPFWTSCAQFTQIRWQRPAERTFQTSTDGSMRDGHWFTGGQLNFAENLLLDPTDDIAIISHMEGASRHTLTRLGLWNQVAALAASLRAAGVVAGDRVAGVLNNSLESLVAMLATASLGAIWSSCSPDFGVGGITDRLSQIEPKVVFFTTGYAYNGKWFDCRKTIVECLARLPSVKAHIMVGHGQSQAEYDQTDLGWEAFMRQGGLDHHQKQPLELTFTRTNFDHPLYIMFSSGTTGVPKCIVHGVGGTLLQHKKELILHCDIKPNDRLMYFTTCGWMMWNWMASTLSTGASLVLYDGSPSYPNLLRLWEIVDIEGINIFGTSPKFLQVCINSGLTPKEHFDLPKLKTILSTGSPLLPEHFNWIYKTVKADVHLASISGGTDIVSCFALGNPLLPVRVGEIQSAGLGMAVEAWNDQGQQVYGEKGELVCTKPFVSMPLRFWNDPTGQSYTSAYFNHFTSPVVWRHGDFIEKTANGGWIIHGRSDATLNPGGIRIGTAEIYRQVESMPEIDDSIAIGHKIPGDVEIVLFVKLADGLNLDDPIRNKICSEIRKNLTARHVPARIFSVSAIPYTRSGKKVEMAVSKAIHGEPIANLSALANPEALDEFREIALKLRSVPC